MATLIDSYSESNNDNYQRLYAASINELGQSFTCGAAYTLASCKFYLKKGGSPTGNAYAKIYAHSGTYGTNSVPTGAALATSDAIDVSTLSTSYALVTFTFSGANAISLDASTYYIVQCVYTGGTYLAYVEIGMDNSSPSHSGNVSYLYSSVWYTYTRDAPFYVYGEEAAGSGSASVSLINPAQALSGTADRLDAASGVLVNPAQSFSASLDRIDTAAGALVNPAQTISGALDRLDNVAGSLSNAVQTVSSTLDRLDSLTGDLINPDQTFSATLDRIDSANGNLSNDSQTFSSTLNRLDGAIGALLNPAQAFSSTLNNIEAVYSGLVNDNQTLSATASIVSGALSASGALQNNAQTINIAVSNYEGLDVHSGHSTITILHSGHSTITLTHSKKSKITLLHSGISKLK